MYRSCFNEQKNVYGNALGVFNKIRRYSGGKY